ncbi:MAG: hypothetical protein L7V15_05805 [Burkholderiales bacterium]|nr:hypothetical protein [Burkholderiales bacterium]
MTTCQSIGVSPLPSLRKITLQHIPGAMLKFYDELAWMHSLIGLTPEEGKDWIRLRVSI